MIFVFAFEVNVDAMLNPFVGPVEFALNPFHEASDEFAMFD